MDNQISPISPVITTNAAAAPLQSQENPSKPKPRASNMISIFKLAHYTLHQPSLSLPNPMEQVNIGEKHGSFVHACKRSHKMTEATTLGVLEVRVRGAIFGAQHLSVSRFSAPVSTVRSRRSAATDGVRPPTRTDGQSARVLTARRNMWPTVPETVFFASLRRPAPHPDPEPVRHHGQRHEQSERFYSTYYKWTDLI